MLGEGGREGGEAEGERERRESETFQLTSPTSAAPDPRHSGSRRSCKPARVERPRASYGCVGGANRCLPAPATAAAAAAAAAGGAETGAAAAGSGSSPPGVSALPPAGFLPPAAPLWTTYCTGRGRGLFQAPRRVLWRGGPSSARPKKNLQRFSQIPVPKRLGRKLRS